MLHARGPTSYAGHRDEAALRETYARVWQSAALRELPCLAVPEAQVEQRVLELRSLPFFRSQRGFGAEFLRCKRQTPPQTPKTQ